MLSRLKKTFNHLNSIFFIIAFVAAIFFPKTAQQFKPYIFHLLIVLLFLGFIKMDYSVFKTEIRTWKYQLYLSFLILFGIPIIHYALIATIAVLYPFLQDFAIAILLIFGAPIAAATPAICQIIHGHLERSMISMIITYLFVPFTLPFLIWICLRQSIHIDLIFLAVFTSMLIFSPLLLALLSRKFFPTVTNKLASTSTFLSFIIIFCIVFASGGELFHLNSHTSETVIIAFALALFFFIFSLVLGFFLSCKKQLIGKKTAAMLVTWRNLGLSLVLADQFFNTKHPEVVLFIIVSLIIWPLMIMPVGWIFNNLKESNNNL